MGWGPQGGTREPPRHWGPQEGSLGCRALCSEGLTDRGEEGRCKCIPVYLNQQLSTPQGGRSVAVFYPLGHPTPYASGDCQYRRRQFGKERNKESGKTMQVVIGVGQWVTMDSLKLHLGLPHPTPLRPAGRSPLKWSPGRSRGGLPKGVAFLSSWSLHTIRLHLYFSCSSNIENKAKQMFRNKFLGSHRHHISPLEFKSIWRTFRNNL
jgi:hypothetical protein